MSSESPNETVPDRVRLMQMISGYWVSQSVYVAAELGIADLLAEGPRHVNELAEESNADPESLYRLLRALASVGVFAESGKRQFELTPLAEFLSRDHTESLRAMAMMMGDDHYVVWGHLLESVRTGEVAFDRVMGQPVFEYLADRPEKGRVFDEAMSAISVKKTQAVLDAFDFSEIGVLADVGGGNGSNLIATLQRYPEMRGLLYDLPHVVERAQTRIDAAQLASRCRIAGGNFFDSVPRGADAYFMRHIIHDWDDKKSLSILRNCYAAMSQGCKLLVAEGVVPRDNSRTQIKMLDLTMLLIPGGKERTEDEYRLLFEQAGFDLLRVVPTAMEMDVLEAVRR